MRAVSRYRVAVGLVLLALVPASAVAQRARATGDQHRDYVFAPTGQQSTRIPDPRKAGLLPPEAGPDKILSR